MVGDRLSQLQAELARPIAARITIVGRSSLHAVLSADPERWLAEMRRVASDVGDIWLERLDIATSARIELAELRTLGGPMGQLARSLEALRQDPGELSELCQELAELERRIPRELREGPDALLLTDPTAAAHELGAIEQLLLPLLFDAERG